MPGRTRMPLGWGGGGLKAFNAAKSKRHLTCIFTVCLNYSFVAFFGDYLWGDTGGHLGRGEASPPPPNGIDIAVKILQSDTSTSCCFLFLPPDETQTPEFRPLVYSHRTGGLREECSEEITGALLSPFFFRARE